MRESMLILAVEDEAAVAQLLALILCGPTCRVLTAHDGVDALEKIEASDRPFDVIITDHNMPRMTGLELVRQLRARSYPGKIAVLSAHLDEANLRAYRTLEVDLLLSKPFDVGELRHAVEVLREKHSIAA